MKIVYTMEAGTPSYGNTCLGILTAVRVAKRYRDRIPTPAQLMADFNMSRATAYRWVSALKEAA
jgi:hypothetical protein